MVEFLEHFETKMMRRARPLLRRLELEEDKPDRVKRGEGAPEEDDEA